MRFKILRVLVFGSDQNVGTKLQTLPQRKWAEFAVKRFKSYDYIAANKIRFSYSASSSYF